MWGDCKFKVTQVARNLLELEGKTTPKTSGSFAETLRNRLPSGAAVVRKNGVVKYAGFNEIVTASVGCVAIPVFNGFLAQLRQMGIAADVISTAAFGQHSRKLNESSSVTFCAIRGIPHMPRHRSGHPCACLLRGGIKQCPRTAKIGSNYCSRHSTKKRRCGE